MNGLYLYFQDEILSLPGGALISVSEMARDIA